jgi:hypothetical protein
MALFLGKPPVHQRGSQEKDVRHHAANDELGPYLGQPGKDSNDDDDDLGPYLGQPG